MQDMAEGALIGAGIAAVGIGAYISVVTVWSRSRARKALDRAKQYLGKGFPGAAYLEAQDAMGGAKIVREQALGIISSVDNSIGVKIREEVQEKAEHHVETHPNILRGSLGISVTPDTRTLEELSDTYRKHFSPPVIDNAANYLNLLR